MITKKDVLKIIKKGGATINKNGHNANYLKSGFMVSIKDCYILQADKIHIITKKANKLLKTIKKGEYLGFWVDNGLVYIDISKKFFTYQGAFVIGNIYNQKSIFDLKTKNCIFLQ